MGLCRSFAGFVTASTLSFALFSGAVGVAHAATYVASCEAAIIDNVSPNAGCERGSVNNDKLGNPPIQVNIDSMFGIDTWEFLAKDNDLDGVDEGDNPLGLKLVGGLLSGTWSIANNAFALYDTLMLVIKGSAPETYVGYLLNSTSGTYESTFFNKNDKAQAISHVSLYGVVGDGPAPIPLPAAGWLMLAGLGSLAALRRRKRA